MTIKEGAKILRDIDELTELLVPSNNDGMYIDVMTVSKIRKYLIAHKNYISDLEVCDSHGKDC